MGNDLLRVQGCQAGYTVSEAHQELQMGPESTTPRLFFFFFALNLITIQMTSNKILHFNLLWHLNSVHF